MRIKKGFIFAYYCFDIADSITLDQIQKVLGKKAESCVLSTAKILPVYVQYKKAPLLFKLGFFDLKGFKKVSIDAKVYDFGVLSLRFSIPFSGTFTELRKTSYELLYKNILEEVAKKYMRKIKKEIEPVLLKPREEAKHPFETYSVFHVAEFDKNILAENLIKTQSIEIAKILKPDIIPLSRYELNEAVSNSLSYYNDELVMIGWNASFIYDKRLSFDVIDILEFATINLLELRYYDSVLDEALDKAYDDIESLRKKKFSFAISPYGKTLDQLQQVKLDVSEVIDKMSNFLKLIGELYLAKVYATASKIFYLDAWKASIKEKLDAISATYSMLSSRTVNLQMVVLETAIVLLFVIDIILIIFLEF